MAEEIKDDKKEDEEDEKQIEQEEKTIKVKKSVLDKILDDMEILKKDNEALMYAADKSRLAKYNDSLGTNITRNCRLRIYNGKIVVGWGRLIEDVMEKDGNGIWHERQIIEVYTEDGEKYAMKYPDFTKMVKVVADIEEKIEKKMTNKEQELFGGDSDKKLFYSLKVTSKGPHLGKTFKLAENFINS